jgi:transposase-like protein
MRLTKTRDRRSHQMVRQRKSYSNDFKKQVVESILSGSSTQAELAREHRVSPVMINRWKKDYKAGKFFENVTSTDMARLELRIRDLERLVGKLTLENEILKKIRDLDTKEKKESSSIVTSKDWDRSKGGAK